MTEEFDSRNSGAMFVNDRKRTERHPDRSGYCEIVCPECGAISNFWVSGWIRIAKKSGQKFLSLAFTPKEDQGPVTAPAIDEDVPF